MPSSRICNLSVYNLSCIPMFECGGKRAHCLRTSVEPCQLTIDRSILLPVRPRAVYACRKASTRPFVNGRLKRTTDGLRVSLEHAVPHENPSSRCMRHGYASRDAVKSPRDDPQTAPLETCCMCPPPLHAQAERPRVKPERLATPRTNRTNITKMICDGGQL